MTTQNKQLVQQALGQLIGDGGVTALEPLLSNDFRHHRPDDRTRTKAEWLTDVGNALTHLAAMKVEILHVLSDGDHVVVHSRRHLPGGGPGIAVVDILRIADDQIAEAWELIDLVGAMTTAAVYWPG